MATNTTHTATALAQLIEQFQDSSDIKALIAAFVDRAQDLENALFPLLEIRNVDTMTGDRLDGLGQIVNVGRGGRTDDEYRLRIRAELAILKSTGIARDLVSTLQLLIAQTVADIQVDEYYPKTIYLRPRNFSVGSTDMDAVAGLLRRAAPAGTSLQVIYSTTETSDDAMFRYSDTAGTPELSSTHGFGAGTYCGAS